MNKSITYHLLHQGRAKYTLIRPASAPSTSPEIKHVVMGADSSRGEVRQLVVEGGWWKASEIPEEDLNNEEADRDKIGCLISEASTPLLNGACLRQTTAVSYTDHALPLDPQVVVPGADKHLPGRESVSSSDQGFPPSAQASTLRTTSSSTEKASWNSSVETNPTLQWSNCSLTLRSDERQGHQLRSQRN